MRSQESILNPIYERSLLEQVRYCTNLIDLHSGLLEAAEIFSASDYKHECEVVNHKSSSIHPVEQEGMSLNNKFCFKMILKSDLVGESWNSNSQGDKNNVSDMLQEALATFANEYLFANIS